MAPAPGLRAEGNAVLSVSQTDLELETPMTVRSHRKPRQPRRYAPQLEFLEDRVVLSDAPVLIKDINLTPAGSAPSAFTTVQNTHLFIATDPAHGQELWKTDGTPEGTVLVKDINPGPESGLSFLLFGAAEVNGTLFFLANDGVHADGLWKSDGTPEGTSFLQ